jgi:hypothetical protein
MISGFSEAHAMKRRLAPIYFTTCLGLLVSPHDSWAASFMWPSAGPYVNEIAHLLFLGATIFFIYEIRYAGLKNFPGFRYLLWAWGVLAVWNLDALLGRGAAWTLSRPIVSQEGHSLYLHLYDLHAWVVFITQLSNFILLIPALYLFSRGIKALAKISQAGHP